MNSIHRLRRHADYQVVYKRGRKSFAKHMSYFFTPRASEGVESGPFVLKPVPAGPRIGLTVGKVLGNAVVRNRIKRRMRAAVSKHVDLLGGASVDVALHPKKMVAEMEFAPLEQDVANVFRAIALKLREQK